MIKHSLYTLTFYLLFFISMSLQSYLHNFDRVTLIHELITLKLLGLKWISGYSYIQWLFEYSITILGIRIPFWVFEYVFALKKSAWSYKVKQVMLILCCIKENLVQQNYGYLIHIYYA